MCLRFMFFRRNLFIGHKIGHTKNKSKQKAWSKNKWHIQWQFLRGTKNHKNRVCKSDDKSIIFSQLKSNQIHIAKIIKTVGTDF